MSSFVILRLSNSNSILLTGCAEGEREKEKLCVTVRETEFVVEREYVGGGERICGPTRGVSEEEEIS